MYEYEYDSSIAYEKYRDEELLFEIKKHKVKDYYPHFHFATEVCCVRSGSFDYAVNGKKGRAETGDIVFINPMETHQYYESENCEVTIVIMSEAYSGDFIREFGDMAFDTLLKKRSVNAEIFALFDEYFGLYKSNYFIENKVFANKLYSVLCRNYTLNKKGQSDVLLINILEYIYNNYKQNLTLDSVAEQFSYSKVTVSKLFQQRVNVDFRVFVNNVRAEKVRQMLHDVNYKDWNLLQIAMECGFTSLATFYRSYKRCFGKLPDKDLLGTKIGGCP